MAFNSEINDIIWVILQKAGPLGIFTFFGLKNEHILLKYG
jgi:hypothetical protein